MVAGVIIIVDSTVDNIIYGTISYVNLVTICFTYSSLNYYQ